MTQGIRFFPDTLRSINSSTFTGSYQAVGTPLAFPTRLIKFTNNSNQFVTISWDGTNDHEVCPANSFVLLDVTTNRDAVEDQLLISVGVQFYVKGSAGSGSFYISTYHNV